MNSIFNKTYPVIDHIVTTIHDDEIVGKNKRYQKLYDSFAKWYTPIHVVHQFFYKFFKTEKSPFENLAQELHMKSGDIVLEVSIGTGENLTVLPNDINLYGLDISLGMLRQCFKRYNGKRQITLVHGMAEKLPFNNATFDVVYHIGGINFFTDKKQAILEMIRVAKPGARFFIADETEKVAKSMETNFIVKKFFINRDEIIVPPVALIPENMLDIKLHQTCKFNFINDEMWIITFQKPL